ncbi:hypothetical protein [Paracidovorax citrulli]|uniref:hypothetical protein n=1 Tax=Paracidovorax citrulli TaxID=80869 RepID=UPI003FA79E55
MLPVDELLFLFVLMGSCFAWKTFKKSFEFRPAERGVDAEGAGRNRDSFYEEAVKDQTDPSRFYLLHNISHTSHYIPD